MGTRDDGGQGSSLRVFTLYLNPTEERPAVSRRSARIGGWIRGPRVSGHALLNNEESAASQDGQKLSPAGKSWVRLSKKSEVGDVVGRRRFTGNASCRSVEAVVARTDRR